MTTKKILAVDLDGIITKEDPYKKTTDFEKTTMHVRQFNYIGSKPNDEMIEFLQEIDRNKYEIVVYTSRDRFFRGVTENWLTSWDVPYDDVIYNKLYFDYFIDDKATNNLNELKKMMKK